MAMDNSQLANLIKSKIDALSKEDKLVDIKVWTAVAESIVEHIQQNAKLKIGSLSSSGAGNLGAPVSSTNTNQGEIE